MSGILWEIFSTVYSNYIIISQIIIQDYFSILQITELVF